MDSREKLYEIFVANHELITKLNLPSEINSISNLVLDVMMKASFDLLNKRDYYRKILKDKGISISHADSTEADLATANLIKNLLDEYYKNEPYNLELEGIYIHSSDSASTYLGDELDNTKQYYQDEGNEFGSGLMHIKPDGTVVVSVYVLPDMNLVYLAIPMIKGGCWCNSIILPRKDLTNLLQKQVAIRRPRSEPVPPDIEQGYKQKEEEYKKAGYSCRNGKTLTAIDTLSVTEGGPITKFVYYSKPWDALICMAIAFTAGARVQMYVPEEQSWKDAFPIDKSFKNNKSRVLFCVERD